MQHACQNVCHASRSLKVGRLGMSRLQARIGSQLPGPVNMGTAVHYSCPQDTPAPFHPGRSGFLAGWAAEGGFAFLGLR